MSRRPHRLVLTASIVALFGVALLAPGRPAESASAVLAAFMQSAGLPAEATYGRIRIAAIGVDTWIAPHLITADGHMPDPHGPADVAWYDFRHFPGMGGAPGAGRSAVLSAHVDYNATVKYSGTRYRGPGAFGRLAELVHGDIVEIERAGVTLRYAVSWQRTLPEDASRWAEMWSANVPIDSLTLFTCTGEFDPRTATYSSRTVVRAERVEGIPRQITLVPSVMWTVGISGTTHPAVLARAQSYPVRAIWAQHATTGRWLSYTPGAPAFTNTLLGHLHTGSVVLIAGK